jgi:hypothetical protein
VSHNGLVTIQLPQYPLIALLPLQFQIYFLHDYKFFKTTHVYLNFKGSIRQFATHVYPCYDYHLFLTGQFFGAVSSCVFLLLTIPKMCCFFMCIPFTYNSKNVLFLWDSSWAFFLHRIFICTQKIKTIKVKLTIIMDLLLGKLSI